MSGDPGCLVCGSPVEITGSRGPIPVYCSAACRQRAFRARHGLMADVPATFERKLAQYLVDMGLAESIRGYGHATGEEVAAGVVAFMTAWKRDGDA